MKRYLRGIGELGRNGDDIEHYIGPPLERSADGDVERLLIGHVWAVEADGHERLTVTDIGGLGRRAARGIPVKQNE